MRSKLTKTDDVELQRLCFTDEERRRFAEYSSYTDAAYSQVAQEQVAWSEEAEMRSLPRNSALEASIWFTTGPFYYSISVVAYERTIGGESEE
jgi:hypothetical protein